MCTDPPNHAATSVTFALVVFGVFIVTLRAQLRASSRSTLQHRRAAAAAAPGRANCSCRCCPGRSSLGALAAMLAVAYTNLGLPALFGAILVLVIFQYLIGRAAALGGARRAARSALDPARVAAARRAHHADGDARAARPQDRAPRGGGGPLRAGARGRGGLQRGGTGAGPHGRAAARHRQVRVARPHPAREGAVRRGLGR